MLVFQVPPEETLSINHCPGIADSSLCFQGAHVSSSIHPRPPNPLPAAPPPVLVTLGAALSDMYHTVTYL